jgi:hypothetical protein
MNELERHLRDSRFDMHIYGDGSMGLGRSLDLFSAELGLAFCIFAQKSVSINDVDRPRGILPGTPHAERGLSNAN